MAKHTPTELDKALAFVLENPDEIHAFYNTFLNSFLYLPTHNAPEQDKEDMGPTGNGKELHPIFTESEDTIYLMIFDSLERLGAWAQEEVGYVGLEGHTILEMMDPKFHWFLNYGSEYGREFSSGEIAWLKSAVQKARRTTESPHEDTEVVSDALDVPPEGLISALNTVASQRGEVLRASLGQILIVDKMDRPELALAIQLSPGDDQQREDVLHAFTTAARSVIDESTEFWIFIAGESSIGDELLADVEPFYTG